MSGRNTPRTAAGKTSSDLNTPRGGRSLQGGKQIISEVSSVIRGTATAPDSNAFVHFHIKRRILPNSKDSVIVPIALPTPVKSRPPVSARGEPTTERAFVIGGKTFDVPDRRVVKPVASPKRREVGPRPVLERPSMMTQIVQVDSPSRIKPTIHLPKTGKHIEKQQPPKQDVENGPTRFTKPPFWDEQSKPPAGCAYAKPTRAFSAPKVVDREKALMSPRRVAGLKKNESVVNDCFPNSIGGTPVRRSGALLLDHNAHFSKGFDDAMGRKRCSTPQPIDRTRVRAPTLANQNTNVFRIHPLTDHAGKNMSGHERKARSNDALEFGANFGCGSARRRADPPVGHPAPRRSASAPSAFRRSDTSRSSSVASLIEAPFDRTTNPGKYEPTYDSRQTCKPQKPYTRPMLKVGNKPPVLAAKKAC